MRRHHPAGPPAALALGAAVLLSTATAAVAGSAPAPTVQPSSGTVSGTASSSTPVPGPGVPAPAASGETDPAPGPPDEGLQVLSVVPAELRPGGRVVLKGQVDGGPDGLVGARVEVRRASTRSSSVSSLERWTAAVDPLPGPAAGDEPFEDPAASARTELVVEVGDVAPGASAPFTATLEAADVGLRSTAGAAGAYGLQLLLLSDDPDEGSGEGTDEESAEESDGDDPDPVDDERGFLLWSPDVELSPTRLSTTVHLQGPPPLPATGLPDPAALVSQTAPGGRLDRLLTAAGALDADWVVDPVLLAGLALTADPTALAAVTAPAAQPGTPPAAEPTGQPGQQPGETGGPSGQPSAAGSSAAASSAAASSGVSSPSPGAAGSAGTPQPSTDPAAVDPGTAPGTAPGTTADPTEPADPGDPGDAGADQADAAVATRWLTALGDARGGREVVLTDWADPDPARLRAADDVAEAWAAVRTAQETVLPDARVEELLGGGPRTDVLDARSGTTAPDLATLAEGRTSVLLPEDLVPLQDPFALTFTPDAVTEVTAGGEQLTAVLHDASLSADTAAAVEGSPLALTRVLARLATTTLQRPSDPRLLSVALPADLDPAPGAAERVASALAGTAWAETVPLSTAVGTPPSDEAREPLPSDRAPDVPGVQDLLDAVADSREVAAAVALEQDPAASASLDLRTAAALSRSAEVDAPAELAARLVEQTSGTVDGVHVVPGARVTLVAAQAALPVTVVNDLDAEVDLVLEVRSRSPRLQVPETRVPVTVAAGQRAVVDVPVVAVASGAAEVTSQLVTAGGRPWGPQSTVTVNVSTQAEGRVLTGVGIGVAVLFVLGSARAFARNRRGRELAGAGPVEP